MLIEFLELLRCPGPHEETPLVTVASRREGGAVTHGTLGCPVCGASYRLADGEVRFGASTAPCRDNTEPSPDDAMRLAALLGLSEPGMRVMLLGSTARHAATIAALTGAHCLAVTPPHAAVPDSTATAASRITIDPASVRQLPLATRAVAALACDAEHATLLGDAARVVRPGGRIVAPVTTALPPGVRELARDEREWVAEVQAPPSAPVAISVSRGRSR